MSPLIGVDLGGTKIEVAVLDAQGQAIDRYRRPTPVGDYAATIACVAAMVEQCIKTHHLARPLAIGMAIPGCLDPTTQTVRGANSVVLNGQPMQSDLQGLLQCTVHMENDANCLAVSEAGLREGAAFFWSRHGHLNLPVEARISEPLEKRT